MVALLSIHAPRLDRLAQVLVDSVAGLVVDARMSLLERPLELVRHLVLIDIITGQLIVIKSMVVQLRSIHEK